MSSITIDKNLEPYRVGKVPNCYYIPNYLTKEQEQQLIANVSIYFKSIHIFRFTTNLQKHGKTCEIEDYKVGVEHHILKECL